MNLTARAETLNEQIQRMRKELDQAKAELDQYAVLNPQQCPAGKHADWLVDSEYTHACPWCQNEELKSRLTEYQEKGQLTVTDVVAWLSKKAREYRSNRSNRESAADAIARLADKVSRGAIR